MTDGKGALEPCTCSVSSAHGDALVRLILQERRCRQQTSLPASDATQQPVSGRLLLSTMLKVDASAAEGPAEQRDLQHTVARWPCCICGMRASPRAASRTQRDSTTSSQQPAASSKSRTHILPDKLHGRARLHRDEGVDPSSLGVPWNLTTVPSL